MARRNVHLQWFADPDEGVVDEEEEEVVEDEKEDEEEDEVVLMSEEDAAAHAAEAIPEAYQGKTQAELVKMLQDQGSVGAKPDQSAAIADGFAQLGKTLQTTQQPQEPAVAPPKVERVALPAGMSEEQYKKQVQDGIFDDTGAYDTLVNLIQAVAKPLVSGVESRVTITQMHAAQATALTNESVAEVYGKYKDEVDKKARELLQKVGPNTEIFTAAIKQVRQEHIEEIIEESVAAKVEAALAKAAGRPVKKTVGPERGGAVGGGLVGKKKVIKTHSKADRKKAAEMGMPIAHYMRNKERGNIGVG